MSNKIRLKQAHLHIRYHTTPHCQLLMQSICTQATDGKNTLFEPRTVTKPHCKGPEPLSWEERKYWTDILKSRESKEGNEMMEGKPDGTPDRMVECKQWSEQYGLQDCPGLNQTI